MKVLFISNSIGGLRNFRYELIEKLRERGDDIYILSPLESSSDCFKQLGCNIIHLPLSRSGLNPFVELRSIYRCYKSIKSIKPNVVLAYTIKPNIYGSIVCRWLNIPIIANVTGLGKALEGGGPIAIISRYLYKFGFKKTDFVYFQNNESLDFFKKNNIHSKEMGLISGSGVNLKKFEYSEYPSSCNGLNFLYIGRILREKGIQEYLDCAKYMSEKYSNLHFHIVGIKDDAKYSNMVDEYHNKGLITFYGAQSDVRPYIQQVHCLIHPSFYPEGMSNVLLESAAMGRPAITTDKSGCVEIVEDNVTGYIVQQCSSNDLIDKVMKFVRLPHDKKVHMGLMARKKVEMQFDREMVVKEYMQKIDILTGINN